MAKLEIKYWLIISVTIVLLILPTILNIFNLLPVWEVSNIHIHGNIEAIGGVLSLMIVVLLYLKYHNNQNEADLLYVALSFFGMGIYDIYHSFTSEGNTFVLSHVISIFSGGFWFGFLMLPEKIKFGFRNSRWLIPTIILWFVVLLLLVIFGAHLPLVTNSDGQFTIAANIINIISGIGFFAGSFLLFRRFALYKEPEIFFIAIIGLLQGFSRLTFHWSELWDISWWIWHGLRLAGSLMVFYIVLRFFNSLILELEIKNDEQQVILDTMPFGIMIVNYDKEILHINKAATSISGYNEADVTGKKCFETLCTADCDNCPVLDQNITMSNKSKLLSKKDGTIIPIIKSVVPIELRGEKVLLEGFIDDSEREKALGQLEKNETKFREIFDSVTNSIIIIDFEHGIVDANKTASNQYGYSKEEFLNLEPYQLIHPDYRKEFDRFTSELKRTGHFKGETIDVRKDGSTFYTDVSGTIVTFNDKPHLLAAIRDITEMKTVELELRDTLDNLKRSNKELEQFTYVSSHDLQEPLRKIKNFSDLLLYYSKEQLNEKARRYVSIISESTQRMQLLIDNLLSLTRINNKKKIEKINMSTMVRNIRKQILEEQKNLSMKIEADNLPEINADNNQIFLLLYHIISNSVKFRGIASPVISINGISEEDFWRFEISDNGIGFDMEYAERIFTVFQRLNSIEKFPGTGIGLAICKKIIEQHSGEIWAESAPGIGTTIFFTIKKQLN